jgi:Tol biopolymer transport system component/tRNA A-37 threonylcarbamoyl transferase component Bud32
MDNRLAVALADRYRIERELGQGGMATVYLAHDIKHDRRVALKVLHPDLAATIGVERFLSEIKVTANLQHPNILGLFDSGIADGQAYYVMPFVDGESLRNRLNREKQLPVADALRIATGVAAALEYAHGHDVIHRDIKPENILLQSGQPVVADFGIALAVQQAGGQRLTQTGMSLGTPQYMSPEQAMGERTLDARTDIYALGIVTYEMLAGEPPFTGPNAQAIVAQVLTGKPRRLVELRETVSPSVDAAVHQALQKLPADRFGSAAAFADALAQQGQPVRSAPRRTRAVPMALAAGAVLGLVAGILFFSSKREPGVTTGAIVHVTTDEGLEVQPAISPDGKTMVYAAGTSFKVRLFLRPVDGGREVPATKDSVADQQEPQWSPSGTSILFLTKGGVDTVAAGLGGGTATTLINGGGGALTGAQRGVVTATWSPDGREIVFVRRDSLFVYTIASGKTRLLSAQYSFKECAWSARGDHIACTTPRDFGVVALNMGNIGPSTIYVIPAAGGAPIAVTDSTSLNTNPVWSPDSRRLYFVSNRDRQRDIYYTSIGGDGRAIGEIHRLTTALNAVSLSISRDGRRLAYSVYTPQANVWALPILANGTATFAMATQVTFGHQLVESMEVTPDGKALIFDADRNGNSDIWRLTFGEREAEALTSDMVDEFGGLLSPDGRRLVFYGYPEGSGKGVIMVKPMTGGGPVQRVNATGNYGIWPEWMPDSKSLTWVCAGASGRTQCSATQDNAGVWHVDSTKPSARSNWSPDGQWRTNPRRANSGLSNNIDSVWIYRADSDEGRLLYGRHAPADPRAAEVHWGPDSRTLYFRSRDQDGPALFWSLSINGGAPRLIARLDDLSHQSYRNDFTTDGKRLYFALNDRQSDISVVELIER